MTREKHRPYPEELVECLGEIVQYVYDTYGKFLGTAPTLLMGPYMQVQHIDLEFYDTHVRQGAYQDTHRLPTAHWHNIT